MLKNKAFELPFLPNKKQGQNFLFSKNYLQKIVANCPLKSDTVIIEVGSGYGSLTNLLAENGCQKILSYEKDERLFNWLITNNQNPDKVIYFHKDILLVDWPKICSEYQNFPIIVVGNLPYYLANSLIVNLLFNYQLFETWAFLVQKEVASRWVAQPANKYSSSYSSLSVLVNFLTTSSLIFDVPNTAFAPPSAVDGALVVMKIRSQIKIKREKLAAFWSFLKNCFHFRRKTLWNNLRSLTKKNESDWEKYFLDHNYPKNIRPHHLSSKEYWQLFVNCLEKE
jgi:16S rRNA (adenine1518-N6/adenine1519-N6)-dimethyltransferase